ncbi:MAG: DUF6602 domain-containing protein [Candidatus Bathyarchaeia archaeon]
MVSSMRTSSTILGSIEANLKHEFERIRNLNYNQNTKGYSYEKILKEFYTQYLGGIFDFYTRVPLIDAGLEYETIFAPGENEFDVVATYRNAMPRMVLEVQGTSFIPYDATAFITEVKQTLTKSSLKEDLEKLGKLSKMKLGGNVHLPNVATPYSIGRPIRILLYYQREIDEGVLWKMLEESKDVCDFLVMFDQNKAFLNGNLPITKRIVADLKQTEGRSAVDQSYPLLKLMYFLTLSVEYPMVVNAWGVFENLFSRK